MNQVCRYRLFLAQLSGLTLKQYYQIVQHYPDTAEFFDQSREDYEALSLKPECIEQIMTPSWQEVERQLCWAEQEECSLVAHDREAYPQQLLEISQPPPFLYVQGHLNCLQMRQVAIVGSRKASTNGLESAYQLAFQLAHKGIIVTSGMALGVDTQAHLGAIETGQTIAVLGTGIDQIYPRSNHKLKDAILKNGAIVSEFPLNVQPNARNFPRRNRIISGLSQGVVIVEAAQKSGSLITARYALEQNRDVMALPGLAGDPNQSGSNQLIKQGAFLVENAQDVLSILGHDHQSDQINDQLDADDALTTLQQQVLAAVDYKWTSVDLIQQRTKIDMKYCLSTLSELAWLQFIDQSEGSFLKRKNF